MERYLDNYIPSAKRQCVEDEDILPNVEVKAVVYAYCQNVQGRACTDDVPLYDSSVHGAPVYVGQTIQDITERDKQHLSCTVTPFDKHYLNPTQYTLVILCRRTFAPATSPSAFRDDTLRPAAEWMDVKEKHFISHLDTYHNGWNSTKGGQGRAWLVAMREAIAKVMAKRFETVYMPAFRDHHKEHGHPNAARPQPVLGKLVSNIRGGYTAIPPQYEEELMEMGLDLRNQIIVQRDELWETVYMPAFRDFHKEHGHPNAAQSHPVLGNLVINFRTGNTTIPPQHEDELMEMGLDLRNQYIIQRDELWETVYMPAFRDFHKEHGHPNAAQSHPVIGKLMNSVRTGNTAIPPQHEDELMEMGLDLRNQHIVQRNEMWETKYIPAFRDHYKEHEHVNAMRSHPVLGNLVHSIRGGHTAIPSQYEDKFKEWGFFWCTQNLARNVSRMLGRTVASLDNDAEAMDAVTKAAVHHAMLRALRSTLTKEERKVSNLTRIPFCNTTIGDGIARFYADAASMEVEERDVVEETCV
jgi:hypothetical protein